MSRRVFLIVEHPAWQAHASLLRQAVREASAAALNHIGLSDNISFTVLCTDDAHIRLLNHDFRGQDKPTNVLSFASDEAEEGYLGDIVLSMDTLEREAGGQGKSLGDHFVHLVVHALLHLLGRDHEEEAGAKQMEAEEIEILQHVGIDNPYL